MKRIICFVSILILNLSFVFSAQASIADKKVTIKDRSGKSINVTLKEAALRASVPERPLNLVFAYFDRYSKNFDNHQYISVIDFRIHSSKPRFFVINTKTGAVDALHTAHGRGSDPDHDGMADRFSNVARSNASSLGFYQISETYFGKHGYSVKMDGLSPTNSNARARAVVIHGADYVKPGLAKMGRSWGCPALDRAITKTTIDKIKEGSLMLIYAPSFEKSGLE